MSEDVLVRSGEAEFWVRVDDADGPSTIGLGDVLSFEGVRKNFRPVLPPTKHPPAWRR